jgi:hypothetical protein
LNATVTSDKTAANGTYYVSVSNPAPGGGVSADNALFISDNGTGVTSSAVGTSSSSPTGTATAATSGSPTGVQATATGSGTVSVAQYASDPAGAPSFTSVGRYYDVNVESGSSFSQVQMQFCDLNGGNSLQWWNAAANAWQPVSPAATLSGSCLTFTATSTSQPSVSNLTGDIFALAQVKTDQTITFNQPPPKTFGDAATSISSYASASSGLPVSFSTTTTDRCTVTSAGVVNVIDVGVDAYGCAVTASQSGDATYNPAPDQQRKIDLYNKTSIIPGSTNKSISWSGTTKQFTVALLSAKSADGTTTFNASRIDPTTITIVSQGSSLAPAKVAVDSKGNLQAFLMDVDGDGLSDLLLYFNKTDVFTSSDVSSTPHTMIVNGNLKKDTANPPNPKLDGRAIRGTGQLTLTP